MYIRILCMIQDTLWLSTLTHCTLSGDETARWIDRFACFGGKAMFKTSILGTLADAHHLPEGNTPHLASLTARSR